MVPSGLDIAQFNSLFSVEGEAAKIGIDQLSIVPEPVSSWSVRPWRLVPASQKVISQILYNV